MLNSINEAKKIVTMISHDDISKNFFNNGGCSKLARYLMPFFKTDCVEIMCIIYTDNNEHKEEISEQLKYEHIFELYSEKIISINHVALVHNNIVYDANGATLLEEYIKNNSIKSYIHEMVKFDNKRDLVSFFYLLFEEHKYGFTPGGKIKEKIKQLCGKLN